MYENNKPTESVESLRALKRRIAGGFAYLLCGFCQSIFLYLMAVSKLIYRFGGSCTAAAPQCNCGANRKPNWNLL